MQSKGIIILIPISFYLASCSIGVKQPFKKVFLKEEKKLFVGADADELKEQLETEGVIVGADVYKVKEHLEKKGVMVGAIKKITKSGEILSMTITLQEFKPNFLDTIAYASESEFDIQFWRGKKIHYIIINSDPSGVIFRITTV